MRLRSRSGRPIARYDSHHTKSECSLYSDNSLVDPMRNIILLVLIASAGWYGYAQYERRTRILLQWGHPKPRGLPPKADSSATVGSTVHK